MADVWSDFDALKHGVKSHTVDRLKQIITGLIEECRAPLSKGGKKQELIDKITAQLDKYKEQGLAEQWNRARGILYKVKSGAGYSSAASFSVGHSYGTAHATYYTPTLQGSSKTSANLHNQHNGPSGSTIVGYNQYVSPVRPVQNTVTPVLTRPGANPNAQIRFKSNPFFRIDQSVSEVVECPESTGAQDRRSQSLLFQLTQEQLNKLSQSSTKYQLRLYCTSSTFYSRPAGSFRPMPASCPIEFPGTCEVRVNGEILTANLKGVKKKPGTAPPADLGKTVRKNAGSQNKLDIVYVNTINQVKKYYLVVFLVEASTVDQLVDKLRKGKTRSMEEVKAKMVSSASEDDDIVIEKQKMSLKCPLSFTRIQVPCRSDKCVHPQCFDAYSWYSMMEQTTTWLCPVCEKVLDFEDLIIDGYFEAILKAVPDSVEEVEVEPEGEWHTSDNKYSSSGWKSKVPDKGRSFAPSAEASRPPKLESKGSGARMTGKALELSSDDVVILDDSDSDREDEGRVKKELSPTDSANTSFSRGLQPALARPAQKVSVSAPTVIDLTVDSDPEEDVPIIRTLPARSVVEKRKNDVAALDREDRVVKRARVDSYRDSGPLLARRESTGSFSARNSPSVSAAGSSSPFSRNALLPAPPQAQAQVQAARSSSSSVNGRHVPAMSSLPLPLPLPGAPNQYADRTTSPTNTMLLVPPTNNIGVFYNDFARANNPNNGPPLGFDQRVGLPSRPTFNASQYTRPNGTGGTASSNSSSRVPWP